MVISASSARDVSESTDGVAAVVVVFSVLSMVGLVLKMVTPDSFTLIVKILPLVCATVSEARTDVRVNAYGIRNVTFAVPVVKAVLSSLAAMINDYVTKGLG